MTGSLLLRIGRSPIAGILAAVLAWLCTSACESNRMVAVSEQAVCLMQGDPCSSKTADCCSGTCDNGTCATLPPSCGIAGNPCTAGTECCSGSCNGTSHTCEELPGEWGCFVEGELCLSSSDCCSAACATPQSSTANTGGPKYCQPIDGCRPLGELCGSNEECCSGICDKDYDSTSTVAVTRCHLSAYTICGAPAGHSCTTASDCCSGICDGASGELKCGTDTAVRLKAGEICGTEAPPCEAGASAGTSGCLETREGVSRCGNVGTPGNACASASACCDTSVTDCGMLCLPLSGSAQTTCSNLCVPPGGPCRAAADCCTDQGAVTCHRGQCHLTGLYCRQVGQPCTVASDCCNGLCLSVNGPFEGTFCTVTET